MIEETRTVPNTREGKRRKRPASKAAAGFVLASLLASWTCSTAAPPKTAPPKSNVLLMPGFRVAPPPGEGWHGLAERSIRTASFSKKWGGYLRFITDEQRRADLSVTAITVPLSYWSTTGDELTTLLKGEYAMDLGFGVATAWETVEYAGRKVQCLRRAGALNETAGFRGVEAYDEEMGIWESNLYGLFFPPDLESSHRYFEIYVQITSIDSAVRFHKDPERGLFEALVRGLEIDGPFADIPGPAGALARAIVAGDSEAALKAIDEGAGINATLSDWTPLEAAAACDRRDLAGMLVRDERLTGAFSWGTALTPLLLALVAAQPDIAAVLLEKEARVDGEAKEGALAPLSMAAVLGSPGVVSRLIERGADIDVRAVGGRTPLMFACESGSHECAQALIEAGADLDLRAEDGGTALMTAVDWGRVEIMRLLLEHGAEINIQDNEGWSCLLVAIFQGDAGLVGELIAAGADVDANVFATGQTALLQALEGGKFDIARMLIASGANVNLHKDGQVTPLMLAVAKGQSDLVLLLIENGADVNAVSDDQRTALKIAESGGLSAIADLLIKAGAKR